MNSLKENSSSESNSHYSNSYIYDTELSFATNNGYETEFKIDTSSSAAISHSAPTSLTINDDLFNYQQYTPNIDYIQCLPSTDNSIGSSCSSGTNRVSLFSHPPNNQPITSAIAHQINNNNNNNSPSSYIQSNLHNVHSVDSYFTNDIAGNPLKKPINDIENNDASVNHNNNNNNSKDGSKSCRGRGRSASNASSRKRHLNQQSNDDTNLTHQAPYGRGKHGKALASNIYWQYILFTEI